ncbi:MAG: DUF3426 domain-containing protein, partial [Alphaproteobacteria bacterium]|nr:DUF3426 domain-containing protein [Alphaproteobacteria bacterium]
ANDLGRADDMGDMPPPIARRKPADIPPIPKNLKLRRNVRKKTRSPVVAWASLGFVVLVIMSIGYIFQRDIVNAFPPSKKVYLALGMDVDILGFGLELPEPTFDREVNGEDESLIVRGKVVNTTSEMVDVPFLRADLLDTPGNVIHSWIFEPESITALPGESVSYVTKVVNPPRGAVRFEVTFATKEEAQILEDEMEMMKEMQEDAASSETSGEASETPQNSENN